MAKNGNGNGNGNGHGEDGLWVIVFASRDSVHVGAARLLAEGIGARFIDRLTCDIDELVLIAQYQIVEPVVILALRDGRVVARIPRLVTLDELRRDLQSLT